MTIGQAIKRLVIGTILISLIALPIGCLYWEASTLAQSRGRAGQIDDFMKQLDLQ